MTGHDRRADRARLRAAAARHLVLDGLQRRMRRRRFAGGDKLGEGNLGRPVQIADKGGRQRQQNKNLDQRDPNDGWPEISATFCAVGGS